MCRCGRTSATDGDTLGRLWTLHGSGTVEQEQDALGEELPRSDSRERLDLGDAGAP